MAQVSVIDRRRAGILLHLSSLPGPWGTGDLGEAAHRFLRSLVDAGASLWQVLPLGPPGFADSPYQARSSFAGNPLFVPLERLAQRGLLHRDELPPSLPNDGQADFAAAARLRAGALRMAFERWRPDDAYTAFRDEAANWLSEYAFFAALHDAFQRPWWEWPEALVRREPDALAAARRHFAGEIAFHEAVQSWFWEAWEELRAAARASGVLLIGDVPFYPALDSADVWANQRLFLLDGQGRPTAVAGVPPDAFSATGQLWGNPVYRWQVHREEGYRWWVERLRWHVRAFDAVRLDHFRGFAAAWHVPASARTAAEGHWEPGPGLELFVRVRQELGGLPFILEDLGLITEDVHDLRRATGCPGMAVLQFAFDGGAENPYLPHNVEQNAVVYPGTHDNDTARGWWASCDAATRARLRRYLGCDVQDPAEALTRLAMGSVAGWAVIPMQDALRLGSEARMNTPARLEGNWRWRATEAQMACGWETWFREMAETYGRTISGRERWT